MAHALPSLAMTRKAKLVLDALLKSRLMIPETKPGDALQMAVSAGGPSCSRDRWEGGSDLH